MDFTPEFILPFGLGKSVEHNATQCYDYFLNEKTFGTDFEGFIDIEDLVPGDEGRKIVAMVRDNLCVTAKLVFFEPPEDTFLGLRLDDPTTAAEEQFVADLKKQGIEAVSQYNGIALPDHFVTIELGESICWWDPVYWGREGFIDSAVALDHS